ncbi:uncharacterized protein LOC134195903 [Corticium candelabrum]|uniref:uncharacterized protein LOC134195903 n=1 Tax=Corticium candelabrum TaxID=121492 RepID=UPI002E270675|nr:uncharacterized protein LOC134195903 [Corticium candelabrum]
MGKFVANDGREVHFDSACSGWVRIYRPNGTTILQHQYLQHELNVHYAKIEGSAFVYGEGNERTYSIHQSRSTREAEEEYKSRRSRNDESDQEEIKAAVDILEADQDTPVLEQVAQALGEFGIYGKNSPCALPLYGVAMSVTRRLQPEQKEEKNEKTEYEYENELEQAERQQRSVSRERRWWKSLFPPSSKDDCTPNRDKNCLGMCGRRCSCWSFVCGDCCYHQGCYEHDRCCTNFWSFPCLFPIGISCTSYHPYPKYCP